MDMVVYGLNIVTWSLIVSRYDTYVIGRLRLCNDIIQLHFSAMIIGKYLKTQGKGDLFLVRAGLAFLKND